MEKFAHYPRGVVAHSTHVKGIGTAGIYTYEIAEMKVEKTSAAAREHEFPLLCTMEQI